MRPVMDRGQGILTIVYEDGRETSTTIRNTTHEDTLRAATKAMQLADVSHVDYDFIPNVMHEPMRRRHAH